MSRLASFQGPSTPSKSPIASPNSPRSPEGNTPTKINRSARPRQQGGRKKNQVDAASALNPSALDDVAVFIENEIHKELRETLLDIRRTARSWEDLVRGDGFKAAKEIIDARTTIQLETF
jgi:hypothetical protein